MNELKCSGEAVEFECGGERYAFDIKCILEILNRKDFTFVPRLPEHISGVINLMGDVIPVIDLNIKLGGKASEITDRSCLMVIEYEENTAAVRVDRVLTSLHYDSGGFMEVPEISGGGSIVSGYITDAEGKRVTLLDAEEIFRS